MEICDDEVGKGFLEFGRRWLASCFRKVCSTTTSKKLLIAYRNIVLSSQIRLHMGASGLYSLLVTFWNRYLSE